MFRVPNTSDDSTQEDKHALHAVMVVCNSPECGFTTVNTRFYSHGLAHVQYSRGAEDREERRP
jgi:hypothetical protein